MGGLQLGLRTIDDGLRTRLPIGIGLCQAGFIAHLAEDARGLRVRQDGAVAREHDQARVGTQRQRQGRRQQGLGLQAQRATNDAEQTAVLAVQRHREEQPRLTGVLGDGLRNLGLAVGQRAAQAVALCGVETAGLLHATMAQVQAQQAIGARHQQAVEKAGGLQPLVELRFQRSRRLDHGRRDTRRHGCQQTLALLDLAGQQARQHFDLVVLLRGQPLNGFLSRRLRHDEGPEPPSEGHCERGHEHEAPDHGAGRPPEAGDGPGMPLRRGTHTQPRRRPAARAKAAEAKMEVMVRCVSLSSSGKYTQRIGHTAWVEPLKHGAENPDPQRGRKTL